MTINKYLNFSLKRDLKGGYNGKAEKINKGYCQNTPDSIRKGPILTICHTRSNQPFTA